jgi:hypothetical protein
MNALMVNPKNVKVEELNGSEVIALTIEDESGNESRIYFSDYKTFINFSQSVAKGGTYGNQYNLKTGEKTN